MYFMCIFQISWHTNTNCQKYNPWQLNCTFPYLTSLQIDIDKHQIALMYFKSAWLGSGINILRIKIGFKATYHLKSLGNLHFLLPPLIFRL